MFAPLLRPTCDLAPRVLLPGDPGRALALAQALLAKPPAMFNHHRGLWGYTGTAQDGAPLTIQSTGIGGPSAVAVLADLARLGELEYAVRVGTCVGDVGPAGTLVVAAGGDPELRDALVGASGGAVVDVALPGDGGDVYDRTTVPLLTSAREHGVRAAALLAVADEAGDADVEALARVLADALRLSA